MSINWTKSADMNNCTIKKLKKWFVKYPQSGKYVICICENCGKCTRRPYRDCKDLCRDCRFKSKSTRDKMSKGAKKRFRDPVERDRMSKLLNDTHKDPILRQKMSESANKRWGNLDERQKARDKTIEQFSISGSREKHSKSQIKRFSNIEERAHISATLQGVDYCDWIDFSDHNRRTYVLNENDCIKINKRFDRCEMHHITSSIVIYIPKELHQHINHNLKTGRNMAEMNMLALQYLNGCYDDRDT